MKKRLVFLSLLSLFSPVFVHAQSSIPIPTGVVLDLNKILELAEKLGGFLLILGAVLAGIVIIASGIMYLMAGSNQQKVASAKGIFKAGIIGALILFATGIIINTVGDFAQNPFGFFD